MVEHRGFYIPRVENCGRKPADECAPGTKVAEGDLSEGGILN